MPNPISVLVVDDSAFMRKMITEMLSEDPALRVVGQAYDGEDALLKLDRLSPDVITLDVEMPRMDGLEALEQIMLRRPTPTVMLSSQTQAGVETTLRCLERGAVDFIAKPSGAISLDIRLVAADLVAKVKAAAGVRASRLSPAASRPVSGRPPLPARPRPATGGGPFLSVADTRLEPVRSEHTLPPKPFPPREGWRGLPRRDRTPF